MKQMFILIVVLLFGEICHTKLLDLKSNTGKKVFPKQVTTRNDEGCGKYIILIIF